MRYIIEIDPKTDAKIRDLIADKRYNSIYQFVARAVEEKIYLEELDSEGFSPVTALKASQISFNQDHLSSWLRPLDMELAGLASPHKQTELFADSGSEIPWLWGQVNSVLCIKFVLRVLSHNLFEAGHNKIQLSEASRMVTEIAVMMGQHLRTLDGEQKRPRDARFSLSFPKSSEKSRARFNKQYIGYIDGKGKPKGALAWLKFARIFGSSGKENISLTPAGFHFAKLKNPLFENMLNPRTKTPLTQEESDFYVQHVLAHAPGESNAILTICKLIDEECNTPTLMLSGLRDLKPAWSKSEALTYQVGAIARLYQLGMVKKLINKGVGVKYVLTDRVKKCGLI